MICHIMQIQYHVLIISLSSNRKKLEYNRKYVVKIRRKIICENKEKADSEKLEKYIDEKIIKNIKKLEKSREIRKLLDYDELIINGKTYKNLKNYKEELSRENLYKIFEKDTYSDIHGDLTIENIICTPHNKEKILFNRP